MTTKGQVSCFYFVEC